MPIAGNRSRQRISDYGEVFTRPREVNAMLDLVAHECERIESRFLEPACGNGNFLAEILKRKLETVNRHYRKSQVEYERYAVIAVSSVYGIDLLPDNVSECRERLYRLFDARYTKRFGNTCRENCRSAVRHILKKNILCGDALTLETAEGEPIVFSEWSPVLGGKIQRRDFTFRDLLDITPSRQPVLFQDTTRNDERMNIFIPAPVREFPLIHYSELVKYE